jgi:hypothetical protein
MNAKLLETKFAAMGARLKVRSILSRWQQGDRQWLEPKDFAMDLQRDGRGPFFELRVPTHLNESLEATVPQVETKQRHLLLFVRKTDAGSQIDRFLCGHDEREWFVAAVPAGASSVRQAMDALQPAEVRGRVAWAHVPLSRRHKRKNEAFRRQGEWFFVPEPRLVMNAQLVLRHEPLRRGRGKPHLVEELVRDLGQTVYVCDQRPNGLDEWGYQALLKANAKARHWRWQVMRRNMRVYARGTVRHSDHATITLPCWHRVLMNTETPSSTMARVAFLD